MPSGQNSMIINPRERALSSDVNRLQSFQNAAMQEAMLYLMESGTVPDFTGGVNNVPTSEATPPQCTIYSGIMVLPQAGTYDLFVQDGVLSVYKPDTVINPDDSPYKYVKDPGITTLGSLSIAPNAGPGIRIDVVEFTVIDSILETDSRDQFNPATGTFSPITLNKVSAKRLSYRVRQGTPGGGFPGTAAGYVPICVIAVPVGALSLDTCEMWDVRPMAQDRLNGIGKTALLEFQLGRSVIAWEGQSAPPARYLWGELEYKSATHRYGGKLRVGSYTASSSYPSTTQFDSNNTNNWEPGFAPALNTLHYLYVITNAFGLPRWSKYSAAPGARIPLDPYGFFVYSSTAPNAYSGAANIVLPASYGLGNVAQPGVAVTAGFGVNPGLGLTPGLTTSIKDIHYLETSSFKAATPLIAVNDNIMRYQLVPGTHFPPHAKSVYVQLSFTITGAAANEIIGVDGFVSTSDPTFTEFYFGGGIDNSAIKASALGAITYNITIEVPCFPGKNLTLNHSYSVAPSAGGVSSVECLVRGFRF